MADAARTVGELFNLRGRVALVTGGAGYLGRAFCSALAEAGATVVVGSRELSRATAAAAELPVTGGVRHYAVALDHMREASLDAGFDQAVQLAGAVDILVNNAIEPLGRDLTTVTGEEFSRHQQNNTGYFLLARRLRDHAVQRQVPASIIMIGSMYGSVGSYPEVYEGVFTASPVAYHTLKGGTLQMTRHLAVYWAGDGVRVNSLSPGAFPDASKIPAEMVRRIAARTPMRRVGRPEELKGALLFLASDASSFVTGQNLLVDGGWTAW